MIVQNCVKFGIGKIIIGKNDGWKQEMRLRKDVKQNFQCYLCGQQPMWNGKQLVLILDHINGINNDNRLENLRLQ